MAAEAGRDVDFSWDGAPILGIREDAIAVSGEPIDITDNDSDGWREVLNVAQQNEVNISISGVTKDTILKEDFFSGARTKAVIITYSNGDTITGNFYLASFTDTGTYNDAVTFSAELISTGEVSYTPAA